MALVKLCTLIKPELEKQMRQTDMISNKQHELNELTNSEADIRWKSFLVYDIASLKKSFDDDFSVLEQHCTNLVKLLKPKTNMEPEFSKLLSLANNIGNDKYKITCPDKFMYNAFSTMVSRFINSIENTIRVLKEL